MESLIYDDSPLAEYLEGIAVAPTDYDSTLQPDPLSSTSDPVSFAPRGPPTGFSRARRTVGTLKLDGRSRNSAVARVQRHCSKMLSPHLGPDSSKFLERFRYIIVASQLLDDRSNLHGYNPRPSDSTAKLHNDVAEWHEPSYSSFGLLATAGLAFILAWSVKWTRTLLQGSPSFWQLALVIIILALTLGAAYGFYNWQRTNYVQRQATEEASTLVSEAQELDSATATAISLIQEVELVSRGYRISSPLPPISRLEDQGQTRRCERLRRALARSLESLIHPYTRAYHAIKDHAVEVDLERYHDIYEVTRTDVEDVGTSADGVTAELGDPETLRSLKISLQRLHTVRKLFLCTLLAIPCSGERSDVFVWPLTITKLNELSTLSASAATTLNFILAEESHFPIPITPIKSPLTPGRERLRGQIRKFAVLNQGTRELQAKMYLLREESDLALATPSADIDANGTDLGHKLLNQYDAFGADLKSLVRDWEDGRLSLVAALDRQHDHRLSMTSSSAGRAHSRSITPSSLSGLTAVGGSPSDALKILNGETLMSPIEATSSDEEIFEAIALPRPRSIWSREERIARMREERSKTSERREKSDARGSMVRELETVIKFRPRVKGQRVTSL